MLCQLWQWCYIKKIWRCYIKIFWDLLLFSCLLLFSVSAPGLFKGSYDPEWGVCDLERLDWSAQTGWDGIPGVWWGEGTGNMTCAYSSKCRIKWNHALVRCFCRHVRWDTEMLLQVVKGFFLFFYMELLLCNRWLLNATLKIILHSVSQQQDPEDVGHAQKAFTDSCCSSLSGLTSVLSHSVVNRRHRVGCWMCYRGRRAMAQRDFFARNEKVI